jgi:hypothetical protein
VSLASQDDRPYTVPDFEADDEIRARYQGVARELVAAAIREALNSVRHEFEIVQQQLAEVARRADLAQKSADEAALMARAKYANIVPKQRTASGIVRPPTLFFDMIVSMGAANKYYDEAVRTNAAKRKAVEAARVAFADLERIKSKLDAALVVRELEVRRHFKSENGRLQLDADDRLHDIALQCSAIELERADFKQRLAAGTVSDEELRDRTMAQEGSRYLDGDVRGLHCLRERDVRFGRLRYFTFRDRLGHIWLLDYSDDLRLLMQVTFDVVYANDRYLIARSPSGGTIQVERAHARLPGRDPRAGLGVDPNLMRAIVDFVARERSII